LVVFWHGSQCKQTQLLSVGRSITPAIRGAADEKRKGIRDDLRVSRCAPFSRLLHSVPGGVGFIR
jgi:hypothetical protein